MAQFIIRDATRDDGHPIASAHIDARRDAMPWLPEMHNFDETLSYFRDVVIANQKVMVAEVDGRVIGFIAIYEDLVDHLYIAPAHQGHGIGDALLERAKRLRPSGLKLWTFQRNERARRFYERRGFVARESTDGSRNEEHTPDVLYESLPGADVRSN